MRRRIPFVILAVALAALCIRLGFWQLSRLEQRMAANRAMAQPLSAAPIVFTDLPADTAGLRYRRVRISGTADYAHELVIANRSREGSPGVHLFTPVRIPGRDTAVLVNRGWVYAPDGATPAEGEWREDDSLTIEGFVNILPAGAAPPPLQGRPRTISRANAAAVRAQIPYPVSDRYIVALSPPAPGPAGRSTPVRVPQPDFRDRGPHLGYALQWFAFATIALVGAGIAFRSGRQMTD